MAAANAKKSTTNGKTTFEVGKTSTHVCAGCGVKKSIRSFPTTGRPGVRGVECRDCRDKRRAQATS
jgi:hypothetical protein